MKWSLCSTGYKDRPIERVLEFAGRLGLQGVEIWDGHLREFTERRGSLAKLRELLDVHCLSVPAISGYTYFSKSEEEKKTSLREIEEMSGMAAEIGCPLIRTFAGHVPSEKSTEWERLETAAWLRLASVIVSKSGVKLGLELHNNTYADGIEPTLSMLTAVDHSALRIIFDGFNLYLEKQDQLEALHALFDCVDHVHLKNYVWNWDNWPSSVPTPLFDGDIDNRRLLHLLEDKHYDGFASLEYFGPEGEECVRQSIKAMK